MVYIPEPDIVDFKEAILMALAGLLRWQGRSNFITSVTGAKAEVSGGAIYLPAIN
jgi:anhydro-N-acetylmuramic acid kinase